MSCDISKSRWRYPDILDECEWHYYLRLKKSSSRTTAATAAGLAMLVDPQPVGIDSIARSTRALVFGVAWQAADGAAALFATTALVGCGRGCGGVTAAAPAAAAAAPAATTACDKRVVGFTEKQRSSEGAQRS